MNYLMYYLIYLNINDLNAVKIMIILNDYYLIPKRWLIISCIKKLSWRKKDEQNKPNCMFIELACIPSGQRGI